MEENGESANQYDNESVSMSIKAEPHLVYENDDNWTEEHYGNAEENDDSNQDMTRRRRSRRTRFRNLRYTSPDPDGNVVIVPDVEPETTKEEDEFLLQEPSSSTQTKRLQPRVMLKRRKNTSIDVLANSLKEMGLYEELYEFLKTRGISADALKYMKLRHIDELFRGTRLGTKIVFEHKLKEWQNKKGICEVSTTQSTNSAMPSIEESLQQMFSPSDASELSKRLMDAIQQAVHTVISDFNASSVKKSPHKRKLSNTDTEYVDEFHFPLETDADFKSESRITESFAFVNIDENPIPETNSNDSTKKTSMLEKRPKRKRAKLAQKAKECNDETSFPEEADTSIKPKLSVETSKPDKLQKQVDKKVSVPVVNANVTPVPEKIQKIKTEKSAKPSKQLNYDTKNNISLENGKPPQRRRLELEVTVAEVLNMIPFGRRLLEEYQIVGILTPEQRTELVRTVVDYYLRTEENLTVSKCRDVAYQILELFPSECLETYYSQPNKSNPPKGKIWDRFRGRKRLLNKLLNNTAPAKCESYGFTFDDTAEKTDWSDMEEICVQMKNIKDEKELFEQWKSTFTYRRYQLQSESFSNWKLYFDEYPFVKQQNYAQFIDSDINTLYPNLKFDEQLWDEFLKLFKIFYLNRIKHPKSKQLFEELYAMQDLDPTSDFVAIKVFELIHAVLPPKLNLSIDDAQRVFTVEVKDLADLKKVVIERKKNCTDNNLPSKPYIAVVGQKRTYTHFSVILDSTGFSCDSYKDALILCFNLFLFFDISYPQETLGVWLFIQKYFFNRSSLVTNPRVETFINDIKAHKKLTADLEVKFFEQLT